jgi:hypothetical protein
MKKRIINLIVLSVLVGLSACKDDTPSKEEVMTNMLTASVWTNATVTHGVDGDLSFQYENFAIQFSKQASDGYSGNFLVSNGGSAFPHVAGKWKFNNDLTKIMFDTGKEMVFDLTDNTLELDFTVSATGGRVSGLDGHFIFELTPL